MSVTLKSPEFSPPKTEFDFESYRVLDTTEKQTIQEYHDTTTWLAEVLDGNMRSEFSYTFDGEDLVADGGHKLRPVFENALVDAKEKANESPELGFEIRRRRYEMEEYELMIEMAKGRLLDDEGNQLNTMIVISDFPDEIKTRQADIGGYNISRQQTMLRVITKDEQGVITMQSQSLDQSNRTALENIYGSFWLWPEKGELLGQRILQNIGHDEQKTLIDKLTGVYDASLSAQMGGEWYAGRPTTDLRNTMDFVQENRDLIEFFNKSAKTEEDMIKVASTMSARFKKLPMKNERVYSENLGSISLAVEMEYWERKARAQGTTFSGCGVSIGGPNSVEGELNMLGIGGPDIEEDSDQYGSLTFKCNNGHSNRRPKGKLIDKCQVCKDSVRC